ncbi:MAG: BACON domain-containing carbohydrate-binding protein, partial [Bacteroidales bacterium]
MNNNRSFKLSGFAALLLTVLLSVGLAGCATSQPPMISVSKSTIRTSCESQNITMSVMSNASWSATSNSAWCTISPASGNGTKEVQIMVESCAATQERSAVITVTTNGSNSVSTTINVTQGAHNGILMVSPDAISVGAGASSVVIAVASNTSWTASSLNSWAAISKTSGTGNDIVKI